MRIGILGGGQLARMLALAAHPLGIATLCYDNKPENPAQDVTSTMVGDFQDQHLLQQFANQVDIVTFETENIPLQCASFIAALRPFYPSTTVLKNAQDRLFEKQLFTKLGIPTPLFAAVSDLAQLQQALTTIGFPAVLKTRRMGYDGKGQVVLRHETDLAAAFTALNSTDLILEQWIAFQREVSLLGVRDQHGEIRFYPLVENLHQHGILKWSQVAANAHPLAQTYVTKLMQELNYIGVLAVEFFQCDGQLIANEMAPRVHNSGHWTIEGALTSQFENHVRAIAGLPVGLTEAQGYTAMFNCIGVEPEKSQILNIPGAHYHTYNKAALPGRKLGHVTLHVNDAELYQQSFNTLSKIFGL